MQDVRYPLLYPIRERQGRGYEGVSPPVGRNKNAWPKNAERIFSRQFFFCSIGIHPISILKERKIGVQGVDYAIREILDTIHKSGKYDLTGMH